MKIYRLLTRHIILVLLASFVKESSQLFRPDDVLLNENSTQTSDPSPVFIHRTIHQMLSWSMDESIRKSQNSTSQHLYLQDQIHALSLLTPAQPKDLRYPKIRKREKRYLAYLDWIAYLIAFRANNGQAAATTCFFTMPGKIRIVWALSSDECAPESDPAFQSVANYLEELRCTFWGCDDPRQVLRAIIRGCKPAVLRQFRELVRCIARDSVLPARPVDTYTITGFKRARTWSEELRYILHPDIKDTVTCFTQFTKTEAPSNYDTFVRKVSNVTEETADSELADLVVYANLLTAYNLPFIVSDEHWYALEDIGRYWTICFTLLSHVSEWKRSQPKATIEFHQVHTPSPQSSR